MSRYNAKPIPADLEPRLRGYLSDELRRIGDVTAVASNVTLTTRAAAPDKLADGQLVYADGTNWDPGRGESFYARINGAWVDLALDASSAETISGAWTFTSTVTVDAQLQVFGGYQLRVYDSADTQFWRVAHDGTDAVYDITTGRHWFSDPLLVYGGGEAIVIRDNTTGTGVNGWLQWQDSQATNLGYVGYGSGANNTLYLSNQISGGDIMLNLSGAGDLLVNCQSTGGIEVQGSSYKTYPTGMRIGQYTSTIGYIQTPGSTGIVDIWDGATSAIARFAYNAIGFYKSITATTAGTVNAIGGTTINLSPSGNINISAGGTTQCLSGGDLRVYDTSNGDWLRMVNNGTYGYLETNNNPVNIRAAQSGAAQISVPVVQSVADDTTVEFTNNGTGYGCWIICNSYNQNATAIIFCAGSGAISVYLGSNARLGTSGTNPDVDGQANYWTDADGNLHVKNRLGSTRRFSAYHFAG